MRWSLAAAALMVLGAVAASAHTSSTTSPPTTGTRWGPYAQDLEFSEFNQTAATVAWRSNGCEGATFLEVRGDGEPEWRRFAPEPPVRLEGLRPGSVHQVRLGVGCMDADPLYTCFHTPPGFEHCRADHPTASRATATTSLPPGVATLANATLLARGSHDATLAWDLDVLGCSTASSMVELYLVDSPVGAFYPPQHATGTYLPGLGRQQAGFDGLVSAGAYLARFDLHGTCPGQAHARLADLCFQTLPRPMDCTEAQWPGAGNFTRGTLPPAPPGSGSGTEAGPGPTTRDGLAVIASGTANSSPEGSLGGSSTTAGTPGEEASRAAAAGLAALAALLASAWAVRRRLP